MPSIQQGATQHLFCLNLHNTSGDWLKECLRKDFPNSLKDSFFLIYMCVCMSEHLAEMMTKCRVCIKGKLLFCSAGCAVLCRMHASGSHLKKCLPFPWINEQLGRTGQGGAICKCHRHCLLILHIIKANIPNLYQSNQEQAITATGAPGEPRPNSERREQGGRER